MTLICMAIPMTIAGIVFTVVFSTFGFFFGSNSLFIGIPLICVALGLLIIGIILYVRANKMKDEEPSQKIIEYAKVRPKKDKAPTDLTCPACDAPLSKKPPCKCEYCGRIIE